MARNPLPRSNFGTASLVERRDGIPQVDLEEGPDAEVSVDDGTILEAPGLNIELEDDGSAIVDFDPAVGRTEEGGFYDNLVEDVEDRVASRIASDLLEQYEANKEGRIAQDWSFLGLNTRSARNLSAEQRV